MAQKTGHQIHPNPMMCPHDARLRWRLDLTCGSCLCQVWSMRLQVWIPSYKNLENVEIPKDSYSFLFNPIHQWQDPWPPLRSLALQTSESGLCGMVLIGDLDSMIPGPKTETWAADSYWKKNIYGWFIYSLKMVIFDSYVSLPEGISTYFINGTFNHFQPMFSLDSLPRGWTTTNDQRPRFDHARLLSPWSHELGNELTKFAAMKTLIVHHVIELSWYNVSWLYGYIMILYHDISWYNIMIYHDIISWSYP